MHKMLGPGWKALLDAVAKPDIDEH